MFSCPDWAMSIPELNLFNSIITDSKAIDLDIAYTKKLPASENIFATGDVE